MAPDTDARAPVDIAAPDALDDATATDAFSQRNETAFGGYKQI